MTWREEDASTRKMRDSVSFGLLTKTLVEMVTTSGEEKQNETVDRLFHRHVCFVLFYVFSSDHKDIGARIVSARGSSYLSARKSQRLRDSCAWVKGKLNRKGEALG